MTGITEAGAATTTVGSGVMTSGGALPLLLNLNHCMTLLAFAVDAGTAPASAWTAGKCGDAGATIT